MSTSTTKIWNDPRPPSDNPPFFADHSYDADNKLHIHFREDSTTSGILCYVFLFNDRNTATSTKIDSTASSYLIQKIAKYRNKEANWDGYCGEAPSEETIEDAITLIKKFSDQALPNRIGLSNDGEISLIWENGNLFADFGVIGDGTFTYFIKHNQKKLYGDDIPLNQNIPKEALDQLKS